MVLKKLFYFEMLVLVLLFTAAQNLKCETVENKGFKHIKNYSYKEYDHSPQNWGMVQADNGLLYIANQGGVLEFDGVSWRIIKVPTYETARSLAIDETGTIFVGGENKIGYLTPDKYGTLQYVSLLDHFDEKYRNFFDVWATHATKNGIYFRTSKFLFRWEPKTKLVKVWSAGVSKLNIISSFVYKGNLFIQKGREGLFQVMNDSFKLLPGTKACAVAKIYMMAPYENEDSKTILIGTRKKGFFLYDGQKAKPFPTEVDVFLKAKKFLSGLRLPSGDYALATLLGGLVFMDSLGRQKDIINMTYGLQDEMIYSLFMDAGENLWLCLNSGISKIEYLSPASSYDKRSNLHGNVLSIVRHRDIIYAGTSKGLFQLDTSSEFHPVTGISSICWSLVSSGDSLLVAASDGVSFVKNNVGQRFTSTPSYVLLPSTHQSGRTWCGTSKGLMALTIKEGSWGQELLFKRITQEIRYIAEGREGNVWLLTRNGGVLKAEFPNGTRQPVVTSYNASHKLPEKLYYIGQAAGDVLFASEQGVFRFDEKRKSFILHQVLGLGAETLGGSKSVFRFAEDKNKQFWFHARGRNFQVVPAHGEPPAIHYAPFRRDAPIPVNAIYPDPDGKKLWFADLEGLIRYDSTVRNNYRQDFQAIVRKVLVNEKLIFGGSKSSTTGNHEDCYQMRDYKERNLYFEYGAPFFEEENKTLFRSFMAGHDKGWSAWSSGTGRNYTNLAHGLYTFRVQAKNVYAHHGAIDEFQFKILPPWYVTWWAFLLYILGFSLLTYLIVKWRRSVKLEHETRRLEFEKQKLEVTVKERTKEINSKNHQLEHQTHTLKTQSEKLKEMDQVKSRFFANISHEFRTPLTLIMSPIEQMLEDSEDKKRNKMLNLMLRNSHSLLTLINQLLDLARLDSRKMKLKAARQDIIPFLRGIFDGFRVPAEKKRQTLKFQTEEETVHLYFDAQKMEEVMNNLLMNAVSFTPSGGGIAVSVSLYRGDKEPEEPAEPGEKNDGLNKANLPEAKGTLDFVRLSVRDTGEGMSTEQLALIFDRFYQTGSSVTKGRKGTGIGLALTKELITLHHGKINVHSHEGKGTEFVILLPTGCNHLNATEITDSPASAFQPTHNFQREILLNNHHQEDDAGEKDKPDTEIKKEPDTDSGIDTEDTVTAALTKKNDEQEKNVVLVVEDNADVRSYIRGPLQSLYTVVEACDGKEGIAKAKELIPDLIVSDIMMPEADGYELCRELKKDVKTSHIPIVLLTAKAAEESIIEGLGTGADDYVTKPFNTKILLSRIKNLIDLRRQLQLKIQREKMLLPSEISVSSVDNVFLKEFQGIIEKNLSDSEFQIMDMADLLFMSRSSLFRKIKAITGETPHQFLISYRLNRAAQFLKNHYGNITEIAMATGFASSAHFSKAFKKKFHQSPSSYQATESQNDPAASKQ